MNPFETQNWVHHLQRDMLFAPIDRQDMLDDIAYETEDLLDQWTRQHIPYDTKNSTQDTSALSPGLVGPTLAHLSHLAIIPEACTSETTQQLRRIIEAIPQEPLVRNAIEWLNPSIWFDQLTDALNDDANDAIMGQTLIILKRLQLLRATLSSYDMAEVSAFDLDMIRVEEALKDHLSFNTLLLHHSQWIHEQASLIDPLVPGERYEYLPWYDMLATWLDRIESAHFTEAIIHLLHHPEQTDQQAPIIDLQPYIEAQSQPEILVEAYQPRAAQAAKQAGQSRMLRWRGSKLGWDAHLVIPDGKHLPDDAPLTMTFLNLPPDRRLLITVGTHNVYLFQSTTLEEVQLTMGQVRQWSTNNQLTPVVIDKLLIDVGKHTR